MRPTFVAFLSIVSASVAASSACGSSPPVQGSSTAGSGGGGGTTTTTTTTTTTSTIVDAGADVDHGMPSTTYPAPHAPGPQVVASSSAVLASPKLVPVFFNNDNASMVAEISDFVAKVVSTQYFAAATAEYGVSGATTLAPIMLKEAAPGQIDDAGIQAWLAGKLNGNDPDWPVADANTLYLLHYPAGTGITQQSSQGVQVSCQNFGGYHSNITLDSSHSVLPVAYAVIPRCSVFYPASAPGTPQTHFSGIDATTAGESHEIMEAITDPYPQTAAAYQLPDNAHLYWALAFSGGEIGDMCQTLPRAFTKFTELAYEVQRVWSDKAEAAGKDPCVPELPGEVYFNTAPLFKDNFYVAGLGTMRGVKLPVGQTAVVELDLFSEAATAGPWNVDVQDLSMPSTLDLSLDRTSGQNGEKLYLTITTNAKDPSGFSMFQITSTLGQTQTLWIGAVGYK